MPQKRNPDAAELVRAKTGRLIGALVGLLGVMKGLPLAYAKDMQEDKVPVFEAADTLELCLAATCRHGARHDRRRGRDAPRSPRAASAPRPISPTGWCATLGLPFREAHRITGALVKRAEAQKCALADLPLAEMQRVEPRIAKSVYDVLTVERSVASRTSFGGTAPDNVARAAAAARKRFLGKERAS